MKPSLNGFTSWFAIGTALKLSLFFLFCFIFLKYPVPLSILLAIAGGFAGGWVIGWWNTKDQPSDLQPEGLQESKNLDEKPTRISGLRLAKQRRDASRSRDRLPSLPTPFSGFFEKTNRSSTKSHGKVAQSKKD